MTFCDYFRTDVRSPRGSPVRAMTRNVPSMDRGGSLQSGQMLRITLRPTGSEGPKSFQATDSARTTPVGSRRAASGSPRTTRHHTMRRSEMSVRRSWPASSDEVRVGASTRMTMRFARFSSVYASTLGDRPDRQM